VLPILHLNGYKIANTTVLARIPEAELIALLEGYGHRPIIVSGDDPALVHQAMAAALDDAFDDIAGIQARARAGGHRGRPTWPMIVLRTPKGWTGPALVDGVPVEGTWRAHQVPLAEVRTNPGHLAQLEERMRSYKPDELFTPEGALRGDLAALPPSGARRMSANPHTNGGALLQDLLLPDFRDYAVDVPEPATGVSEATRVAGEFLRDVVRANPRTFRVMARTRPRPTASVRCSTPPTERGTPTSSRATTTSPRMARSWRSSPSTSARDGWRATCSPVDTACSSATRRSSTSSTPCSISTPSGSR
jgi:xylulose-5-phosphate/fructose-6-phosphate phosphoketolase